MFLDCGDFRIAFDHKEWQLRVYTNTNPIAGWNPMWRETATFKSAAEWEQSVYSRRVNDSVADDILYFWIDAEAQTEPPNDPSNQIGKTGRFSFACLNLY